MRVLRLFPVILIALSLALVAAGGEASIIMRPPWADDAVKTRIISETAGLEDAMRKGDQPTIVRRLRRWAARNANGAGEGCLPRKHILDMSLEEIIEGFDRKEFGAVCYGHAVFLSKIYSRFGYESIMASWGLPEPFESFPTHVFVVVQVKSDGRDVCLAEDSMANMEYSLEGGGPTDFRDVVKAIRRDGNAKVVLADHYPEDKRAEIYRVRNPMGGEEVRCRTVCMSDLDKWVRGDLKEHGAMDMLRERSGCENIRAHHMLLFPSYCTKPATKPLAECVAVFMNQ